VSFVFEYPIMNEVMKVVKDMNPEIVAQNFDLDCTMTLRIRKDEMPRMKEKLEKIETLRFTD